MKKILIVIFDFPPSSGAAVQRILKLCDELYGFGWEPSVLTAKTTAYESVEFSQKVPDKIKDNVIRATAFDVLRHFGIKGKYFGTLAVLDRWTSWVIDAIYKGRRIVEKQRPDIIMSTTPIPSASIIACYLSRKFQIPWVADYQDPFSYHYMELTGLKAKVQKYVDGMTIKHCTAAVFATESTKCSYIKRFGKNLSTKFHVVENGYAEENWSKVKEGEGCEEIINSQKVTLLYSGMLYPEGRDPSNLFKAICTLKQRKIITSNTFELVFQGVREDGYGDLVKTMEIDDIVRFTPSVPYLDSLSCMSNAQILLVIQGGVFDLQVPGKIYEYIRAGKSILALTPSGSATAKVAESYPGGHVAEEEHEIVSVLDLLIKEGPKTYDYPEMTKYSRHEKNRQFVAIFDEIIGRGEHA